MRSASRAVRALAIVSFGFVAPCVVGVGCGGSEWKPVAGPTVIPAMPPLEPQQFAGMRRKPPPRPTATSDVPPPDAPPATSGSARPATSASAGKPGGWKPPAKPPAPPPKK